MYVYSEKTNKKYSSVDECIADEKAFDEALAREKAEKEQLASKRAERAKEVEDAYQKIIEAKNVYDKLLDKFVEDYGSFHMTVHSGDTNPFNLFDWFFN